MQTFDPKTATETLLNALPAAARLKAVHYTQGGHWLLLWGVLIGVIVCFAIARLRILPALRRRIEARRVRPWLFAFLATVVFSLIDALLELPWSVYAHWFRERSYGLSSQPFPGWVSEAALSAALGALTAGIFLMLLYALMRRSPQRWWLWAAGLAIGFYMVLAVVQPVLIEPLFNHYTPAPQSPTRDAVVALAVKAGVPSDKIYIYNGSKQSNRYTANVAGLFGSARVAMSDVMFAKGADIAEVRGVVGHEMGHYKRGHVVLGGLVFAVMALAGLWLTQLAFPVVERYVRTGATSIADPVGLPTFIVVLSVLGLVATPVTNTVTCLTESDADAFSLRVANEPTGLAKALVKTIEYRADSPGWLEEAVFYDHPSVRRRVQRAMDWKAAHLAIAEAQEAKDVAAGR